METGSEFIKRAFEERRKKNPNFSLRSFARWLDVSPAQISQIISGKRKLSEKIANKVSTKLNLSPREKNLFLKSLNSDYVESQNKLNSDEGKTLLQEDEFNLIADWPHYSILSLSEIKGASADPRWMSRKLGIHVTEARECYDRLKRIGLISEQNKSYFQAKPILITSKDILSSAIQRHHKQNLNLASEKIERILPENREFTSATLAINPNKIKQAKKLINEFKRELCTLLEEGDKEEVYTVSIQLFPNTVLEEEKK